MTWGVLPLTLRGRKQSAELEGGRFAHSRLVLREKRLGEWKKRFAEQSEGFC